MRDIEFRAYCLKEGYMFTPDHFIKHGDGYDCWNSQLDGFVYTEYLMQYTGLKDKNGVKIFEGDLLLALESCDRGDGSYDDTICQVKWDDVVCGYVAYSSMRCWLLNEFEFKVIGNIHENPELLEANQ